MSTKMWYEIYLLDKWINENTSESFKENETLALFGRVSKVAEECGETMQALIGATGQNPRKGFSHTREDIKKELYDVALTALCAVQFITKDTAETQDGFTEHVHALAIRAGVYDS